MKDKVTKESFAQKSVQTLYKLDKIESLVLGNISEEDKAIAEKIINTLPTNIQVYGNRALKNDNERSRVALIKVAKLISKNA